MVCDVPIAHAIGQARLLPRCPAFAQSPQEQHVNLWRIARDRQLA
jgi:hypothetical protein